MNEMRLIHTNDVAITHNAAIIVGYLSDNWSIFCVYLRSDLVVLLCPPVKPVLFVSLQIHIALTLR